MMCPVPVRGVISDVLPGHAYVLDCGVRTQQLVTMRLWAKTIAQNRDSRDNECLTELMRCPSA